MMAPPYSDFLWRYPIKYFRNQKIVGPVEDGEYPATGSEIYVSKIPEEVDEVELFPFLRKAGNIYTIRLMTKAHGKKNRGYCYVTFTSPEEAQIAIKTLNSIIFKHSYLSIEKSYDNCRLFIGGIPDKKSKDDVWKELNHHGFKNITDVIMYRSYSDRALNRGFVFVEFDSHYSAAAARSNFKNLHLWGVKTIVDWSTPLPDVDEEVLNKVKILFIRNLCVTERKDVFQNILRTVLKSMPLEKVFKFKDFAFVHFTSRRNAEKALEKLKDFYKHTKVEITWAIPQEYAPKKRYLRSYLPRTPITIVNGLFLDMNGQYVVDVGHLNAMYQSLSSSPMPLLLDSNSISNTTFEESVDFLETCKSPYQTSDDCLINGFLATSTPIKRTVNCSSNDSGIYECNPRLESFLSTSGELTAIPEEYVPLAWCRNRNVSESSDLGVSILQSTQTDLTDYDSEDDATHAIVMSVVECILDD